MAYTLGNKCAKNLCKRIVLLQLIIENVVTCFFGTQCRMAETLNHQPCAAIHSNAAIFELIRALDLCLVTLAFRRPI